jgi:hypothetical protein
VPVQPLGEEAGVLQVAGRSSGAPPWKGGTSIYSDGDDFHMGGERSVRASTPLCTQRLSIPFTSFGSPAAIASRP